MLDDIEHRSAGKNSDWGDFEFTRTLFPNLKQVILDRVLPAGLAGNMDSLEEAATMTKKCFGNDALKIEYSDMGRCLTYYSDAKCRGGADIQR